MIVTVWGLIAKVGTIGIVQFVGISLSSPEELEVVLLMLATIK